MKKSTKRNLRQLKFTVRRNVFSVYSFLKYNKTLWTFLNGSAVRLFKNNKPQLSPLQEQILNNLNNQGISVTSLSELFPNKDHLKEILDYLKKRESRVTPNSKKPFLVDLLPEIPDLGPEVPFFDLALGSTILDTVNSYLGMTSRLCHFSVRRTRLSKNNLPFHSQNWHRAPQEQKNCRVYIYLSDVTEASGPFMYVPESTKGSKYSHVAPQTARSRGYNSAEIVETKIPEQDRLTVVGKAGTVIFCDSTGLHRGGYSNQDTRTMSTFGYSAPSFRDNIHYSYPQYVYDNLDGNLIAQAALNPKWKR